MASGSSVPPRPKSGARLVDVSDVGIPALPAALAGLEPEDATVKWRPVGTCLAHFDCNSWLEVMRQLVLHPERTSSNILRADILSETEMSCSHPLFKTKTAIKRMILPRRPNLDAALLQTCTVYQGAQDGDDALVVYTPQVEENFPVNPSEVPFYHPKVRAMAFRYQSTSPSTSISIDATVFTHLYIYIVPFAVDIDFNAAKDQSHRLSRTVLALLETQAQHSWGRMHNYQKRVIHDTLVPREDYMDLYMSLKNKHANRIIKCWAESTDARKHVYEDIGIAAYLILLWRATYTDSRGRPPCFVDVGCGNGLLVHLLNAEGYTGFGFDLQLRKSWEVWRGLPGGADLRVIALDAPAMVQNCHSIFPPSSFLIGNHADELTSWLPLLADSVPNSGGFINIPCCLYQLNGQHYSNTKFPIKVEEIAKFLGRSIESLDVQKTIKEFERGPPTQLSDSTSRNVAYLRYISNLHLQAGWHLEKEALRIPSTKNWALIGRKRVWEARGSDVQESLSTEAATRLQSSVRLGVKSLTGQFGSGWKARLPPGKGSNGFTSH